LQKIGVVKVECVAYDNEKAKELNQVQEDYEERERQKVHKEPILSGKRKRKPLIKPNGGIKKARLNPPADTDNEDEDGEENNDLGDEPVDSLAQQDSTRPGLTTRPKHGGTGRVERETYQVTSLPDDSNWVSDSEYSQSG